MANKTIEELKSEAAVIRDATEEGENTATRVGTALIDMIDTLSDATVNGIKGYKVIESTSELPTNPTSDQQMIGYLLDTTLYVWVGTGGDTLDGKYQSAELKGADGQDGAPGPQGPKGDSGVDLGEVVLVNDLTTGGEGSALSAEMGKSIRENIDLLLTSLGEYAFPNGKPRLWGVPYDAIINYLGCDGNQYIDTGINGSKNTGFEMTFRCANTNEVAGTGGSRSTNTNAICFATRVGYYGTQRFGSQSYGAAGATVAANTDYTYKIDASGFWINGNKLSTWSQSSAFTTDTHLFVGWNGSATTSKLKGRIYGAKVYASGTLVFDGIPVRVGQVGYLYDRISGNLFGNEGTGDFTLG